MCWDVLSIDLTDIVAVHSQMIAILCLYLPIHSWYGWCLRWKYQVIGRNRI